MRMTNEVFHSRSNTFFDPSFPFYVRNHSQRGKGPLHDHDYFEMAVVLRGKGFHKTKERKKRIQIGDIYLIPPKVIHQYVAEHPLELINVLFSSKWVRDLEKTWKTEWATHPAIPFLNGKTSAIQTYHFPPNSFLGIRKMLVKMVAEYKAGDGGRKHFLRAYFLEFLAHFLGWQKINPLASGCFPTMKSNKF